MSDSKPNDRSRNIAHPGHPRLGVRLVAFAQITRIGLVPSAPSNVILGALIATSPDWPTLLPLCGVCLASIFLYLGGMVLNDWFDRNTDALERPERPIPSGRISPKAALITGLLFLIAGIGLAVVVSLALGCPLAASYALLISLLVLGYNGWAKTTPFGPLFMGACRAMNVLLGTAVACSLPNTFSLFASLAVGVYIAGVTTVARYETETVPMWAIRLGKLAALAPVTVAFMVVFATETPAGPWTILLAGFVIVAQSQIFDSLVREPSGPQVPRHIGALLGQLIRIDAVLASAWVGFAGFGLLGLWLVARFLRRFKALYSS